MSDDNLSVASNGSISNEKMPCNFCKKEFQQRALFNHLRTKHPEEFIFNIDTDALKKAIKLKTYYEMDLLVPDERDETDNRLMKVYCIFGTDYKTNKGFLTTFSAERYLKGKSDLIKEHINQMNTLLKLKESEKKSNNKQLTRGCIHIQQYLKLAYRFIIYSEHPLNLLDHKKVDTSKEHLRRTDLLRQFDVLVKSLPTNGNLILSQSQIKEITHIFLTSRGFFDGLVGWVDRVYNYPVWVDTFYHTCCSEENPEGRRYGEERDYLTYLTYPGDLVV